MNAPRTLFSLTETELRRRRSAKWQTYPSDVLPLWVAEMDVRLAPPIAEALHAAIDEGDTGYACGDGYQRAWADFAGRRWGQRLDPADIRVVADVMRGAMDAIALVARPGAPVVVTPPVYPQFFAFLAETGRRVVPAALGRNGRLDLDRLRNAFAQAGRGSVFLLCSPHNPTGVVHTRQELTAVAALADEHQVRVVSDEVHAPLVLSGETFTPYLAVPGAESAMTVVSASKSWNLAGVRAALLIGGPDARADLRRLPQAASDGASWLGVLAHTAALEHGGQWLDELLIELDQHRALMATLLARWLPQVRHRPPQGTYFAWLDCSDLGLDDDPASFFTEFARVALNSGPTFGAGGSGHVRLNLAASPALLTDAVGRMAAAVENLGNLTGPDTLAR